MYVLISPDDKFKVIDLLRNTPVDAWRVCDKNEEHFGVEPPLFWTPLPEKLKEYDPMELWYDPREKTVRLKL